jgi:hypothetical protein
VIITPTEDFEDDMLDLEGLLGPPSETSPSVELDQLKNQLEAQKVLMSEKDVEIDKLRSELVLHPLNAATHLRDMVAFSPTLFG